MYPVPLLRTKGGCCDICSQLYKKSDDTSPCALTRRWLPTVLPETIYHPLLDKGNKQQQV